MNWNLSSFHSAIGYLIYTTLQLQGTISLIGYSCVTDCLYIILYYSQQYLICHIQSVVITFRLCLEKIRNTELCAIANTCTELLSRVSFGEGERVGGEQGESKPFPCRLSSFRLNFSKDLYIIILV